MPKVLTDNTHFNRLIRAFILQNRVLKSTPKFLWDRDCVRVHALCKFYQNIRKIGLLFRALMLLFDRLFATRLSGNLNSRVLVDIVK